LNFFTIFFRIFLPGSSMNGIRDYNFFFSVSVYLFPFWLKIIPGRGFIIFWIFLLFFSEFSSPDRVWTEFGTKIFFLFFGLTHTVLAKNNSGKRFYKFLNFFTIFFRIFFPGSSMNGFRDYNFFFSVSVYLIPFWLKILPGRGFIIFWIFLLFFSEFSSPDRLWTEFGTKIFFSLFSPISSRFG